MNRIQSHLNSYAAFVLIFLCLSSEAFAEGFQKLSCQLPKDLDKAVLVGDVPETDRLELAINLPMRNQEALDKYNKDVQDPKNPQYRKFVQDKQYDEMFRPTKSDYQAVVNFAKENGLTVTQTLSNRMLVGVSGTVRDIQKAFRVHLHYYQWSNGSKFRSPDSEPSVDMNTPILQVDGLNDLSKPCQK